MPSPVGHVVAGLAVVWAAEALGARRSARAAWTPPGPVAPPVPAAVPAAACVLLALAPDADILFGAHRAVTHSLGAVFIVGALAALAAWRLRIPVRASAVVCSAAWASHILLDWLGHDSRAPIGIMALWPLSDGYFSSGLDVFADVSRRYWNVDEFVFRNARSVAREVAILAPLAAAAYVLRRRGKPGRESPERAPSA